MLWVRRRSWRALAIAGMAVAVSACAETELASHAVKEAAGPSVVGGYKIGRPYQIAGAWYYPAENWSYRETGIASWYGPGFHGKSTANGETYDQNLLTAAHTTLPMPSIVRVTNLENGRSIKLRVNDRGPFAHGRIIDVSRRAAQLLGFDLQGTARVRVEIVEDESRQVALVAMGRHAPAPASAEAAVQIAAVEPLPPPPVTGRALPPPGGVAEAPPRPAAGPVPRVAAAPPVDSAVAAAASRPPAETVTVGPVGPTGLYVQAGAFSQFDNANRTRSRLSGLGPTKVVQVQVEQVTLFRVRLGPLSTVEEADRMLASVTGAGFPEARIVVD